MSNREPPASYDNQLGSAVERERVVAVKAEDNGFLTVTTEHHGTRCTYKRVRGRYEVGDTVEIPIRSARIVIRPRPWSPFDGVNDD